MKRFNLFDGLVVVTLLVGLPLGLWAYSKASTKHKAEGQSASAEPRLIGSDYVPVHLTKRFNVELLVIDPPSVGEDGRFVRHDWSGIIGEGLYEEERVPVGKVVGARRGDCPPAGYLYKEPRTRTKLLPTLCTPCTSILALELYCVEAESKVLCANKTNRLKIGSALEYDTRDYKIVGYVLGFESASGGKE